MALRLSASATWTVVCPYCRRKYVVTVNAGSTRTLKLIEADTEIRRLCRAGE